MPRPSDLRFTFTPAAGLDFEVVEFTLEEALSEPFRLELELASFDPAVDFGQLLDAPALFTIWRGLLPVRRVHGLVSAFEQADSGFRRTRYRARVEPALARAGLRSDWRIFQQLAVPKILEQVLGGVGITDCEQVIHGEHLPREYCVQAGESDLDFLARLAAEEGLFYAFEHREDGHRLVYGDRLDVHGALPGGPVRYNPAAGGEAPEPALRRFAYAEQVRTARQTQRDYTFLNPRYSLQHSALGAELEHQGGDYERYDYPGRYKLDEAGRPFTATRLLALRGDARLARVEGDEPRLIPGLAFDLVGHPREDLNRGWRPLRIRHHGTQATSQQEDGADARLGTHYALSAELVPDHVDWKPPRPPKPRIDGPHMATVVGPPEEEIYCDEHGRIKVQFPWDRQGRSDEHSSCWIRVAQDWAGAAWGHVALPRIGHEVIVDFLDGDPDQPIVTGRTYHAVNRTPYALPEHKTLSTLKSKEHKGGRANELRIDDTTGEISAALMSDHAASALHLGFLTHPRPRGGQPRGEGFELRSDAAGALRAARGLLLSTEARPQAAGSQLDRDQAIALLEAALDIARTLGDYAGEHAGIAHDAEPQQALTEAVRDLDHGANDHPEATGQGGQPVIAMSAPAGIALATGRDLVLSAAEHVDSIARQNHHLSAGQKVVVNAGDEIGLFAHGGDMRHIAHQGQLLLQAQHNDIKLQADQSVEISASSEHILVAAKENITLICGGAYLKMEGGNIELGMPGTFRVKAANVDMTGPAHASTAFNSWSRSPFDERVRVIRNGRPVPNYRYEIVRDDGASILGVTDSEGWSEPQQGLTAESYEFYLLGPAEE